MNSFNIPFDLTSKDSSLILVLIILLMGDGADSTLIMALLYILT